MTSHDSVHDRLMARHLWVRTAMATERLDLPFATSVITDDLPAVYDANVVVVTAHVPPAVLLRSVEQVAARAGWPHRRIEVDDPAIAERIAPALRDAGYATERYVTMRLQALPAAVDDGRPGTAVVDVADQVDLARACAAQEPWADSDAVIDQMLERERRLGEVAGARVVVTPAGAPVSRCLLLVHAGIAEIDAVSTLVADRGRGWSAAVVRRAIAEAATAGAGDIVLVADADDWPRQWYERFGFRTVGHSWAFRRDPGGV